MASNATAARFDVDERDRRTRIARVLLERAADHLEATIPNTTGEVRHELDEALLLLFDGLEQLQAA